MKKGLFVCYDPHALMQFLQFYCMNDFPAEWDVLCLPVENGEEYMHSYCEKTGLFKNIFVGNVEYIKLPVIKKLGLFFYMFFFAIIGLRKKCCKNILNKYVSDIDQYEILCSNIDTGFISGMLATFGKKKDVIYFEDGAFDYKERHKWSCTYKTFSFVYWQALLMSKMGYCAKGSFYFNPTKYCIKYCTSEKNMKYRNYKDIIEFRQFKDETAIHNYARLLEKLYPELKKYDFKGVDTIFFTFPLDELTNKPEKYKKKIEDYIASNNKRIMLKKHPRDTRKYNFGDCDCIEIDNRVPGEVILPFIKGKRTMFTIACSIMLSMSDYEYDMEIIFFDELASGIDSSVIRKYSDINELKCELNDVNCENVRIIHI